jgi:dTDP-4-amino-4,6-dideoxygalactose transaminase
MPVPFYRHDLGEEEIAAITEACRGLILTTGAYTRQAEEAIGGYLDLPHAVALDSCTAALHLALLALDIGPGDEVITTPMTFVATANAVLMAGATPVFVDVEPETGNLDASRVEAAITPRTKALLPVHLYGLLCDMRALRAIADRHGLAVIEDAAHCIEGRRDGVGTGELGDCACLSFYATKNICAGEGGMLVSRREDVARRARLLSCHGIDRSAYDRYGKAYAHWDMPVMGWKYNLDNLRASLIPSQVRRIGDNLAKREAVCRRYETELAGIPGLRLPRTDVASVAARHLQTIWVAPERRDALLLELGRRQVGVAVNYRAIHLLDFYRHKFGFTPGSFPVAEDIGNRTITLPLYPGLTEAEQTYVIEQIREAMAQLAG